jgi:hypothetical protein
MTRAATIVHEHVASPSSLAGRGVRWPEIYLLPMQAADAWSRVERCLQRFFLDEAERELHRAEGAPVMVRYA